MTQGYVEKVPIDTDPKMVNDSNELVPSQAAVVTYIATQAPTYASLTANGIVYASGGSSIVSTGAMTNGQITIGSTGNAPVVSTLTAGTGISITNGAGAISVAVNISGAGIVGFTGTVFNDTAVTQYNVIVGGATSSTLGNVAPSATSGVPFISQGASANPTFGTAVVAGGGTGSASFTSYGPIVAASTATGALTSVAPSATSGVPFISQGASANPTFGTAVVAGGGTGSASFTSYGPIVAASTATGALTSVAPSATSGVPFISQGASANPTFGTAVVAGGGTGAASFNANGVVISGATTTAALSSLALTDGQLVIGSTGAVPVASTLTAGTNISITNAAGSITVATAGSASFQWNLVSGTSQACLVNNGYILNNAGTTSLYLPATAAVGDTIRLTVNNDGNVKFYPAAGQTVNFLAQSAPSPTWFTAFTDHAALYVVCTAANTTWNVISNEGPWISSAVFVFSAGYLDLLYTKGSIGTYVVGSNTVGQLGTQNTTNYSSPVAIVNNFSFTYLLSGSVTGSAGVDYNGDAWMWGVNTYGQLGTGNRTSYSSPVPVVGPFIFSQIAMSASNTTLGLATSGTVWGWGQNSFGEIGNRTRTSYSSPISVVGDFSFVQISMGTECSYGLKADGTLWAWGGNIYGELGNRTVTSYSSPISVVGAHSFISVVGGYYFVLALKADGSVWAWGNNGDGQLGNQTITSYSSPISVVGNHSFVQIAYAGTSSYGLKADGHIWSWGRNAGGELGVLNFTSYSSPVSVVGPFSFIALPNTCGGYQASASMFAVNYDTTIWGWGNNSVGQLGNNSITGASSPVLVLNTP
jgi:alpha-tubulin suppressor-like RCC1 family protein